jgi:cytochrome c oxidase subunit 2
VHAPDLAGLYGSAVPLAGGNVVIADGQYIRDSILLPQSQIAAGYLPIMPTYGNLLKEEDVLKLVAYIKSLRASPEESKP